jgi:hypothetical protein
MRALAGTHGVRMKCLAPTGSAAGLHHKVATDPSA